MASDRNPDVMIAAFFAAVAEDRADGTPRELAEYQQRFAGYESEIAAAWSLLDTDEAEPEFDGELPEGAPFAGYRIGRVLGRGGQGVVYEAFDAELERPVALKVLHRSRLWSAAARARFAREVEVTARLSHPGICPVYARGFENGVPWIAMRCLEGRSLAVRRDGAADWRTAVRQVREAADAVAHAHGHGIVHRDLKPANLWQDNDGRVLVLDFGMAVEWGRDGPTSDLTMTGEHFGTPGYMAPEQLGGALSASPATDVFALGVVLYELTAGVRPFPTTTLGGYERAVQAGPPDVRRARSGLPRDLSALLRVAMAAEPGERYVDAAAMRADLDALLTGRAIAATAPGPALRLWRWAQRERALAIAAVLLFVVLSVSLVVVTMALSASERSAAHSAITATAALVRTEQFAMAQDRLAACPEGHRGFAFAVLQHELDNGLAVLKDEAPNTKLAIRAEREDGTLRVTIGGRVLELPIDAVDRWVLAPSVDLGTLALAYAPPVIGGTTIQTFDTVTGAPRQRITIASAQVTAMAFSIDGTWLWTAARRTGSLPRSLLQAWSSADGELLLSREVSGPRVTSLLPLDHDTTAIGRDDGIVQLVPHGLDLEPVTLCGHRQPVVELRKTAVGFSSTDASAQTRHWDRDMLGSGRQLATGGNAVVGLRWRDDGGVEAWSRFDRLACWNAEQQTLSWHDASAGPEPAGTRAQHPREQLVAVGTDDGQVALGPSADQPLLTLRSGRSAVTAVLFSPAGDQLAVGHADGVVTVFGGRRGAADSEAAADARERAIDRLAELGHEVRLMTELSSPAVAGGWAYLHEVRLCRRAFGRPWDEFDALVAMPIAPPGVHEFAYATMAALRRQRPERHELNLLIGGEVLALLRCRRFDDARAQIDAAPAGTVTPILEALLAAMGGGGRGGSQVADESRLGRELKLRETVEGAAAFRWLEERLQGGTPWHRLGDAPPADAAVAARVVEILAMDAGQRDQLNEMCFRFLSWRDAPAALRGALIEWTTFLQRANPSAAGPRVARAAALLRNGDAAGARTGLRPLVADLADWRDADPWAVAFLALAEQALGNAGEALRWRNRLIVLISLPAGRNRLGLELLLREVDRGGF